MAWGKCGVIFNAEGYTQVPTPYVMADRIRVYYSPRNNGKAFITYFDLSFDLKTILYSHEKPIMGIGNPGNFDCDGVMPSCVIPYGDELWMYYVGWSALSGDARYQNEIGLAASYDGGDTFHRKFYGPIIGRSSEEPGMAIMPTVIYKNWYRLWYSSGTGWHHVGDSHEPTYTIKYAESLDGYAWTRYQTECIISNSSEEAICRPSVIFEDGKYKMWFSCRDSVNYRSGFGSYRMGYAESENGIDFERNDDAAGISLGAEGEFDSQMIAYPAIIELNGQRALLYNGNGFGQTGIGIAIWE